MLVSAFVHAFVVYKNPVAVRKQRTFPAFIINYFRQVAKIIKRWLSNGISCPFLNIVEILLLLLVCV